MYAESIFVESFNSYEYIYVVLIIINNNIDNIFGKII